MTGRVLLLCLALFAAAEGARKELGCVLCPAEGDHVLPHPTDCRQLVRCSQGTATFQRCVDGEVFSRLTNRCESEQSTECIKTSGPRDLTSCTRHPSTGKTPRRSGSLSTNGACGQDCSAYAGLVNPGETHSVCQPKCSYLGRGIDLAGEDELLEAHNTHRMTLALGLENGAPIGALPSATNMNRLVWNGELAKTAQAWTDNCAENHDCNNCRLITSREYQVGQNAYWMFTSETNPPHFAPAVDAWWMEVEQVQSVDWLSSLPSDHWYEIGHFTQAGWADTYEVGCGYTAFNNDGGAWNKHAIFCNYGPTGNYLGAPMYDFGPAASKCSQGPDSTMEGLCSPPDVSDPCE